MHAAVVADDPDLVHGAVALLDRLRAHDAAGITALRERDRLGERELAPLRELGEEWRVAGREALAGGVPRRLPGDGSREAERGRGEQP